ncbi:tetratricopeptide repeat protein [Campylobacter sp.]|uniref:tetratricopeptide repeat protein n=1 Tax=Campylobacter sp. TaxID=205 RepID=UPI00361EEE74
MTQKSCYNLGILYSNGQGVKQDIKKAVELFSKACEAGDIKGCYNLGFSYASGQGVNKDKQAAKKYFGKACDMGLK